MRRARYPQVIVSLNENRNPSTHGAIRLNNDCAIISGCAKYFGWPGIEGDDTDGHIDDLARFVRERAVVTCGRKSARSELSGVTGKSCALAFNEDRRRAAGSFRAPDAGRIVREDLVAPRATPIFISPQLCCWPTFADRWTNRHGETLPKIIPDRKVDRNAIAAN